MIRPVSHPRLGLETRRSQVEGARAVEGAFVRVSYRIKVAGTGEGIVDVNFPYQFSSIPAVSDGGELAEGESLVTGSHPWWSVGVAEWRTETLGSGQIMYVGAQLVIVVGGHEDQTSYAYFHARGTALQGAI